VAVASRQSVTGLTDPSLWTARSRRRGGGGSGGGSGGNGFVVNYNSSGDIAASISAIIII